MGTPEISNIVILGNCQGDQLARCLRRMVPGVKVEFIRYFSDADVAALAVGGKRRLILVQNPVMAFGPELEALRSVCTVLDFPAIAYAGFHPDLIRPKRQKILLHGPMGSNHSAIVLYGFLRGLNEVKTRALFRPDVFRTLGYFDAKVESDRHLVGNLAQYGLYDEAAFAQLLAGPCFMHNTIHPKLSVISALARTILDKLGMDASVRYPENLMADELATNVVWPVYPEIAKSLGVAEGEYVFQFKSAARHTFGLEEFIDRSFNAYREQDVDSSCHARFASPGVSALDALLARKAGHSVNPYRSLSRNAVLAPRSRRRWPRCD